jgi:hypothetical protein
VIKQGAMGLGCVYTIPGDRVASVGGDAVAGEPKEFDDQRDYSEEELLKMVELIAAAYRESKSSKFGSVADTEEPSRGYRSSKR